MFPYLFTRYICELLQSIRGMQIGCNIGGVFINILAYADDLVLLAPSWNATPQMLKVLHSEFSLLDMSCNVQKTVCMVLTRKTELELYPMHFPCLQSGIHVLTMFPNSSILVISLTMV